MKMIIFITAISILSTTPVFARNIHISKICSNSTYEFKRLGSNPVDNYYSLSKLGESDSENSVQMILMNLTGAYSKEEIETLGHAKESPLVTYYSSVENDPECDGYYTETTKYLARFKFTNLKSEDEAKLNIKNGQAMYLKCEVVTSNPKFCK